MRRRHPLEVTEWDENERQSRYLLKRNFREETRRKEVYVASYRICDCINLVADVKVFEETIVIFPRGLSIYVSRRHVC